MQRIHAIGSLMVILAASMQATSTALPSASAASRPYSVIFYSDRSGNQDIYILHPGEKEPQNLTNHPARDNCPAVSPSVDSVVCPPHGIPQTRGRWRAAPGSCGRWSASTARVIVDRQQAT